MEWCVKFDVYLQSRWGQYSIKARTQDKDIRETNRSLASDTYVLLHVSRKNFKISPFSASWLRFSAFSMILDEKLYSTANGFEKLLS